MHLHMKAMKRSGWVVPVLAGAMALVLALLVNPVRAEPAGDEAPIAKPKPAATQTAPATQSAEEVLWQEILALRQLPQAPAGATQPLENPEFVKTLTQQLEKSSKATAEFLKKYPKSEHAEEVQIQRLDTMRLLAVVNKQPLDAFQAEAQKIVKSDAPVNVKAAAEYMLMGMRMDEYQKELGNSQLDQDQKEQAWRQRVSREAKEFIAKYPKTAFAERFYMLLIEGALQLDDVTEAKVLLEQLRQNHPDSPYLGEIASAIQEVAASTQPAASQSATQPASSQPAAKAPATVPAKVPAK